MSKLKKILVVCVVLILLVVYLVVSANKRHRSALYEQISVNKDTGQTIINTPNQTAEKGGNSNQVTALGSNKFLAAGMTEAQFSLTTQLLTNYVNQNLHSKYQQVAILNSGFKSTGNNIYAKMRLGNSNILLNLNINYYNLTVVDLKVTDPAGDNAYSYDSGPQTTPQTPTDTGE